MIARPCPHCQRLHDLSARIAGDRVYCPTCEHWPVVVVTPSGTWLAPVATAPQPRPPER